MFKALFISRLRAMVSAFFSQSTAKGGKFARLKLLGIGFLMLYAVFTFMSMFGMYFKALAEGFFPLGLGWLYFTLLWMSAFALMFVGSVFAAKSQLYEAKDNELLLSLPIPPSYILASRMLTLLILNYLLELVVAAPAFVIWLRVGTASAVQILFFVLIFLFLPLLSLALSCFFGWILELLTGRMQKNSLITVLFSLIFLGAYMYYFSQANLFIQQLVANGSAVANALGAVSPLFWLGNAVAESRLSHLLLCLLIFLLPFLLVYWALSASFLQLATTQRSAAKKEYKARSLRSSTLSSALLLRELKRLSASPVYILNAGLGLIFILAAAVGLVVKKDAVLSFFSQLGLPGGGLAAVLALVFCLLASTVGFTASSVSLEGKTLWIIKSLPVPDKAVLRAKLQLQIFLTLPPMLLAGAAAAYVFSLGLGELILLLAALSFYVMLTANLGLITNLRHVNLDWLNETQVIKQSISVLLTMLYASILVLLPGALYLFVLAGRWDTAFLSAYALLLALGWHLSRTYLMGRGAARFAEID